MKAALYCRVSTEEQGNKGYSLRQQLEALRRYCDAHDLEVVGEFEDKASGASLDRPGLDTLRDVVAGGGIDLVLAQDRDRFAREPAYHYLLRQEFKEHGTKIRALNDRGDDSPEGELTDGIIDQIAKFERAKTAERTRRGRVRKAQEGKVVGNGTAPYGFYYEDDYYHVDAERMLYVHEIFDRSAAGESLYSIVQHLTKIGAPTPKGVKWTASTVRNIISSDTYLGTFYWGKERHTTTTISKFENGNRIYKKKVMKEKRPESEWISIPVPDSGISPDTVACARESLKGNIRSVAKNGGRTWELSGGVSKCAKCGKHMVAHTSRNTAKRTYYYYRCSSRKHHACFNRKNYPAGQLEKMVMDALVETFQPETWPDFVDDVCDRKLEDLHRLGRADPSKTRERLAGRIGDLEAKLSRARDLFINGDLPRPAYEEKKSTFQDEIEMVQEELTKVDDLDLEVRRVEDLRLVLKSAENPLSGHYKLDYFPDVVVALRNKMYYGSKEEAAKRRQEFYRQMGMRVKVGEELEITLGLDSISVCKSESLSEVIAAPAPAGAPGSLSRPLS